MTVDALLLDLDGTLYVGDDPLPGAVAAVAALIERRVPRRYLTNTTRMSRRMLAEHLQRMGFSIEAREIFTAPVAAAGWLRKNGHTRISLYLPEVTREDFADFDMVDDAPDAVVLGDLGHEWSFERLNNAFRQLLAGATLVALQKNRYWRSADGFTLDAGPFVAALEYAAKRDAVIVGKPSREFFRLAARSLEGDRRRVAVVGDDIEADIGGAQSAGLRGALVRTGKFREEVLAASGVRPDWIADSVRDLVEDWFPADGSGRR